MAGRGRGGGFSAHTAGSEFAETPPTPDPSPPRARARGGRGQEGLDESPQANYGTSATIPALDPELAKQLGFTTEEEDLAALARPPRNKMEALGVAATADALDALIRDGRPEFKGEDGQVKIWTPHRPPRPEKSEGGVPFVIKSEYEPKGDQPTAIRELVEGIARNDRDAGAARRHRLGQDLHHGQGDRGDAAARTHSGAEQDAGRAALRRVQELLPRQRRRVFRLLLRLLPARGLRPAHRHLHREGMRRSTSRSTACATRRRGRCWSATTSSSSPRCRASTASARSRPTRR